MEQPHQPAQGEENPRIRVTLLSTLAGRSIPFDVPPTMTVSDFIHHILDTLSQGENSVRFRAMLRYYEPVLELMEADGEGHAVSPLTTLVEAGLTDGAQCRLAAHPIKGEQLFCRYCG